MQWRVYSTFTFRINTLPFHCAGTFQSEEGPVLFCFLQNSSCQNVAFLSPWCCPQNNSPLPPPPPPPHTHTHTLCVYFFLPLAKKEGMTVCRLVRLRCFSRGGGDNEESRLICHCAALPRRALSDRHTPEGVQDHLKAFSPFPPVLSSSARTTWC